ncbi:hypothetical protein BDP27DRAFT_1365583 [Rhodocollybia butyracea]|uniref:DUF6534 domain-containing protein n=1 Tax=Rhodocollybia butyracea TaxID=206335 RepID=A0A9P5U498_9AGAR|nr:hypothetical protein BDP27DRAFT_1365583 [Rhodocollybia butyracea]
MAIPIVVSTLGPWFISYSFLTVLYGMGLLQTWLYFHWYREDHWILKTVRADCSTLCGYIYYSGQPLRRNPLSGVNNLMQQLSSSRSIFLKSQFRLNDKKLGLSFQLFVTRNCIQPHFLLAVLGIAAGLGILLGTYGIPHGGIAFNAFPLTKTLFNLQLPATFACDLLITISLFIILRGKMPKNANGMDNMYNSTQNFTTQTNSMLQKLMVNAVNRGMLATITAAATLILFLALPGTFYFYLGVLPSSKLYMNSMLAISRGAIASHSIRLPASQGLDLELSTIGGKTQVDD